MMRRAFAFAALCALALGGCDCDAEAVTPACTTTGDCTAGRTCLDGRCVAGRDAAGSDSGTARDAGEVDGGAWPDGAVPSGFGCSADLRDVLAVDGTVVTTCPPAEGCSDGRCIEACAAAAASHGSVGCTLLVPSPPSYPPALPPCLAVFVANTWPRPARLTVTRGGMTLDVTRFARIPSGTDPPSAWAPIPATGVPADEVAVLFLSSDPAAIMPETGEPLSCPIEPAVNASTVVPGSGVGEAFVITSDTPVTAYDILPYGGAPSHFPSAQLLLPASAWGRSYVVIGAPPGTYDPAGPMWIAVGALEDGVTVRVDPSVALPGGGVVPAAPVGAVTSTVLAAGQYAQWELPAGSFDPSGTVIEADGDVAVFSGNRFLRLQPTPAPGGESTHQQLLPAAALGHELVAAPFETRRADLAAEDIPYRIVGAFDGTMLTTDPAVPGVPAMIDRGTVVDFSTAVAFRIRSQDEMHPFAAAQLMATANVPSGSRPGATDTHFPLMLGDEEFVVMFPPAQFLSRYVFFTDPTYPTTSLAVTRVAVAGAFAPVRVECVGELGGWRAVGSDGRFEVTTVDLVRAGIGAGACTNGRHVAESAAPFGIVVWGEDSYSSYAYPAGGNAASLATLPPLI